MANLFALFSPKIFKHLYSTIFAIFSFFRKFKNRSLNYYLPFTWPPALIRFVSLAEDIFYILSVLLFFRKDVRLPQQLQRAMAAEAEAAREARAKVIAAEGEHKSSRALAHAAEIISQTPAALQVGPNTKTVNFSPIYLSTYHLVCRVLLPIWGGWLSSV